METVKDIILFLAGLVWTGLALVLRALAFVLELVAICLGFFFVGFSAGRLSGD